jgi:hypothetical protein
MSEYVKLNLKVGDKVKPVPDTSSVGYYGVAEGEAITVTGIGADGESFEAIRDNGMKVDGGSAYADRWTLVPALATPGELKVGAKVIFNQDYSSIAKNGDSGVILSLGLNNSGEQLSAVKLDKNGEVVHPFTHRFDVVGSARAKATKKWAAKPLSRNSKLYKTAESPALRKVGTIRKLLKKGKSVRGIAKQLGLSKSAVGRVVQRIAA